MALHLPIFPGLQLSESRMSAPLKVDLPRIYFDYQDLRRPEASVLAALSKALKDIHLVEELTLISPRTRLPRDVVESLTKPAPLLSSLHLEGYDRRPKIRKSIFGGKLPNIRRLHLAKCKVKNWSSPVFSPHLTHLTLHFISCFDKNFDMDAIFQLLRRLPVLQQLSISDRVSDVKVHDRAPIVLRHLQKLDLRLFHGVLNKFLTCLELPQSTVIRLGLRSFHKGQADVLHALINTWCRGMSEDHSPFQSLVLWDNDDHGRIGQFYLCGNAEIQGSPKWILESIKKQAGLSIHIYKISTDVHCFFYSLPMLNLRRLVVHFGNCVGEAKPWAAIDAPYLSTIHLVNNGLGILLRALRLFSCIGSVVAFASALTQIILEDVPFPAQCICSECQTFTTSVSCLHNVLAKRERKLGHKLQTLQLVNCYGITEAGVAVLEKVVENVHFQDADDSWKIALERHPWLATGGLCDECNGSYGSYESEPPLRRCECC